MSSIEVAALVVLGLCVCLLLASTLMGAMLLWDEFRHH